MVEFLQRIIPINYLRIAIHGLLTASQVFHNKMGIHARIPTEFGCLAGNAACFCELIFHQLRG
jgi:hypothetical protein